MITTGTQLYWKLGGISDSDRAKEWVRVLETQNGGDGGNSGAGRK